MTGRPQVEQVRCIVSGTCEAIAPALFQLDDSGDVLVLQSEVDGDLLLLARKAAEACPSRALTLQEG